jgi:integrase
LHRVLSQALRQAVRWQLIARNPCEAVDPPKPARKEIAYLSSDEMATLLKTTGLRRGECLGLRWRDVDLDGAALSVAQALEETKAEIGFKSPKTARSRRTVTLPALAAEELRRHKARQAEERLKLGIGKDETGLMFTGPLGDPIRPRTLTKQFGRIVNLAKVPRISFHGLRHSHLTHLLAAGVHPKIASERAGHSSVSITLDVYSHAVPGLQADAALRSIRR